MAKRVKVWPPSGGQPIEIFEDDKVGFLGKGWLDSDPSIKDEAAAVTANSEEETNDGDILRKQRNSQGRVRRGR